MDNVLYASVDVVDCNMPCVCENVSISVYPHDSDDMLHESMSVVIDIQNVKLSKKKAKPKLLFRSHPKELSGSKFVPTCHHCGVIGHIRPQYSKLKREQNHVARSLPKKPTGPKHIVCHHCGAFGHLRPQCSKFHAFIRIKK